MDKFEKLNNRYDELQLLYGAKGCNAIFGYGCKKPEVVLVFMNPTRKNVASAPDWRGLRAQWLGTKQIWDFLYRCNMFDVNLNEQIKQMKPSDWTPEFCSRVYEDVIKRKIWMTNMAKCTQDDARPLPDKVFIDYKNLLLDEMKLLNPKKIIFFGNQVSSIMLDKKIKVSECRRQKFNLKIGNKNYDCYAVFYPVGNGRFNQSKAVEDIKAIFGDNY